MSSLSGRASLTYFLKVLDVRFESEWPNSGVSIVAHSLSSLSASSLRVTKTRYQANGDVILFETFKYDANDNLIEVRNSSNTRVISYSYDSSNNLIKELEMNGDNLSSEVTFEYDSNNNSVEEVRRACCNNNELVLMYRLVKVYDEKNNMIERINYRYN